MAATAHRQDLLASSLALVPCCSKGTRARQEACSVVCHLGAEVATAAAAYHAASHKPQPPARARAQIVLLWLNLICPRIRRVWVFFDGAKRARAISAFSNKFISIFRWIEAAKRQPNSGLMEK